MEELYAVVVYKNVLDYEIIPANEVPQLLLDSPANQTELRRMALIDLDREIDYLLGGSYHQPNQYRKRKILHFISVRDHFVGSKWGKKPIGSKKPVTDPDYRFLPR
ncbi:hypothetical protein OUZ56_012510 [Daphnia magna]|uniref:Uncharacterized protein n=1 Tax=Daphnia magna TaxID=35525 RepID=A0ABQ9Z380_9CRUS|nr:hypothetical protein OUZ56_012510 [Daphnia magna]